MKLSATEGSIGTQTRPAGRLVLEEFRFSFVVWREERGRSEKGRSHQSLDGRKRELSANG